MKGVEPKPMRFASLTDPGVVRDHNEDSFLCEPDIGLFGVADGMGGHACGDYASSTAIRVIHETATVETDLSADDLLVKAIETANETIFKEASDHPEKRGMGTTVVTGIIRENTFFFAWVGDSRIYHFRNNALSQITTDHSLVAELCARGILTEEEARTHHQRNIITRACGTASRVEVALGEAVSVQTGDLILFCSDGLNSHLEDTDIQELIVEHFSDLDALCSALITETNARGGTDNTTLVAVGIDGS